MQRPHAEEIITILLPDGRTIYTSKVMIVALDAGVDAPPENGNVATIISGEFSRSDITKLDDQADLVIDAELQYIRDKSKAEGDVEFEKVKNFIHKTSPSDRELIALLAPMIRNI